MSRRAAPPRVWTDGGCVHTGAGVGEGRQYCCRRSVERGAGSIGGMVFSFLYLAVRALLGALLRSRRGLHVKDVELLVLRHELETLRRRVVRPKLRVVDRAL